MRKTTFRRREPSGLPAYGVSSRRHPGSRLTRANGGAVLRPRGEGTGSPLTGGRTSLLSAEPFGVRCSSMLALSAQWVVSSPGALPDSYIPNVVTFCSWVVYSRRESQTSTPGLLGVQLGLRLGAFPPANLSPVGRSSCGPTCRQRTLIAFVFFPLIFLVCMSDARPHLVIPFLFLPLPCYTSLVLYIYSYLSAPSFG